ncbi:hypothetical protein GOODEAATRI_028120, partial [Goodea atripinnis]
EATDEQPLPVVLFCSNRVGEFISIADFLVNEGLALKERTPRSVKTAKYHPPELPCLGHILITVSAVGDDGIIYARTQNAGVSEDYQRAEWSSAYLFRLTC